MAKYTKVLILTTALAASIAGYAAPETYTINLNNNTSQTLTLDMLTQVNVNWLGGFDSSVSPGPVSAQISFDPTSGLADLITFKVYSNVEPSQSWNCLFGVEIAPSGDYTNPIASNVGTPAKCSYAINRSTKTINFAISGNPGKK